MKKNNIYIKDVDFCLIIIMVTENYGLATNFTRKQCC